MNKSLIYSFFFLFFGQIRIVQILLFSVENTKAGFHFRVSAVTHNDCEGSWLRVSPRWESGLRNDGGVRPGVASGKERARERARAVAPGGRGPVRPPVLPVKASSVWPAALMCPPGGPSSWKWAGSANKQRRCSHSSRQHLHMRKKEKNSYDFQVELKAGLMVH